MKIGRKVIVEIPGILAVAMLKEIKNATATLELPVDEDTREKVRRNLNSVEAGLKILARASIEKAIKLERERKGEL